MVRVGFEGTTSVFEQAKTARPLRSVALANAGYKCIGNAFIACIIML
jgi:hypothetical protein